MKARELIALASASGIDLISAAQSETATHRTESARTRTYQRRGVRVVELVERERGEVRGRQTRVTLRPEWTADELAQAAGGPPETRVPEILFLAALYAFAGQHVNFWRLHDQLFGVALELKRRHGWPSQVGGADGQKRFYLEHLAALVLDEDAHPWIFAAYDEQRRAVAQHTGRKQGRHSLHAVYMGVTEDVWQKTLRERFELLKLTWTGWLDEAARRINARLRDRDE